MPELDLDALELLAKKATPVPWSRDWFAVFKQKFLSQQHILTTNKIADTDYVVAACNTLPKLIAAHRELLQKVQELERKNAGLEARIRYLTEERDFLEWELNDIKRGLESSKEAGE